MPTVNSAGSVSAYALTDPTLEPQFSFSTTTLHPGQTITRRQDARSGQPTEVITYTGTYVTWSTPGNTYRYTVPHTAGPVRIVVPDDVPPFYHPPPTREMSPEERHAMEEQRRQMEERRYRRELERREEYERTRQEAQRAEARAEARARQTLLEFLGDEQITMLNDHSYIDVEADDGSVYRLYHGRDGVYCVRGPMLDEMRRRQQSDHPGVSPAALVERRHFCIHPAHGYPPSDEMLCMKALIEGDYQSFLRIANY